MWWKSDFLLRGKTSPRDTQNTSSLRLSLLFIWQSCTVSAMIVRAVVALRLVIQDLAHCTTVIR